jgi:hypothetical protein
MAYQIDPECPTCKGDGYSGRSTTGEQGECTGEWEEACQDCESALARLECACAVGTLDAWEDAERGRRVQIEPWPAGGFFAVFYGTYRGETNTELHNTPNEPASTREAARMAAAEDVKAGKV